MRYRYCDDYDTEDYSEPRQPDGELNDPCECGGVVDYWDNNDESFYSWGTVTYVCRECGDSDWM